MNKIIPLGPVLVVMVGPSGAGKSTLVSRHFEAREVVSTDGIREELTGDFQRQDKNAQVFQIFHSRIAEKLRAGQRVVADATHLHKKDRLATANIALSMGVPVVYMVVNRSIMAKHQSAGWRATVTVRGKSLVEAHDDTFRANEKDILAGDSLKRVTVIDTRTDGFNVIQPLPRDPAKVVATLIDRGYFYVRVIGDVHGNYPGLKEAIREDDYCLDKVFYLFLGDIVDYGPDTLETCLIVSKMVAEGRAACIRGNHEKKVLKILVQDRARKTDMERVRLSMDAVVRIMDKTWNDLNEAIDKAEVNDLHSNVIKDAIGDMTLKVWPSLTDEELFGHFSHTVADGFRGTPSPGNNETIHRLRAQSEEYQREWEIALFTLVENSPDWIQMADFLFVHGAATTRMWNNPLFRSHERSMEESFALYGETVDGGQKGPDGYPIRLYNWVDLIPRGKTVMVGHAIRASEVLHQTNAQLGDVYFVDTGSSKGGKLSWVDIELPTWEYRDTNPYVLKIGTETRAPE